MDFGRKQSVCLNRNYRRYEKNLVILQVVNKSNTKIINRLSHPATTPIKKIKRLEKMKKRSVSVAVILIIIEQLPRITLQYKELLLTKSFSLKIKN